METKRYLNEGVGPVAVGGGGPLQCERERESKAAAARGNSEQVSSASQLAQGD